MTSLFLDQHNFSLSHWLTALISNVIVPQMNRASQDVITETVQIYIFKRYKEKFGDPSLKRY